MEVEWEGQFDATHVERGHGMYRDNEIREVELGARDAIIHRRVDKKEEYAVIGGKPISVAEHDDGTAEIDGQFIDAVGAERRIRFLTRANLLLAPQGSPVNGRHELDREVERWLDRLLIDPARVEGCSMLGVLWRVYVPLARPTYLAYALVSISYHWNNFLWPLVVTNSVETRPIPVGLQVFATVEQGVDWARVTAATLLSVAPLLLAFIIFQRQFVQSFMRAGIR